MEVASPLPLSHGRAGTKRSYHGSPFLVETEPGQYPGAQGDCSMGMEEPQFMNQPFKRRRFSDAKVETPIKSNFPIFASPSQPSSAQMTSNAFGEFNLNVIPFYLGTRFFPVFQNATCRVQCLSRANSP